MLLQLRHNLHPKTNASTSNSVLNVLVLLKSSSPKSDKYLHLNWYRRWPEDSNNRSSFDTSQTTVFKYVRYGCGVAATGPFYTCRAAGTLYEPASIQGQCGAGSYARQILCHGNFTTPFVVSVVRYTGAEQASFTKRQTASYLPIGTKKNIMMIYITQSMCLFNKSAYPSASKAVSRQSGTWTVLTLEAEIAACSFGSRNFSSYFFKL